MILIKIGKTRQVQDENSEIASIHYEIQVRMLLWEFNNASYDIQTGGTVLENWWSIVINTVVVIPRMFTDLINLSIGDALLVLYKNDHLTSDKSHRFKAFADHSVNDVQMKPF